MRFCTAFKTLFSYAFFGKFGRIMPSDRRLKMPFFCLWAVENPVFFRQNNLKTEPICALESIAERLKK